MSVYGIDESKSLIEVKSKAEIELELKNKQNEINTIKNDINTLDTKVNTNNTTLTNSINTLKTSVNTELGKKVNKTDLAIANTTFTFKSMDNTVTFSGKAVKLGSNLIYITISATLSANLTAKAILTTTGIVPTGYTPNEEVRTSIAGENQLTIKANGQISGLVINDKDDSVTIRLHTTFIKY